MPMIQCPRCSVFSALAQIKASGVMIIDCQDSDINLATTGVQADIERNVFTPVYHLRLPVSAEGISQINIASCFAPHFQTD